MMSDDDGLPVLGYARPGSAGRRWQVKHVLAIALAWVAVPVGMLFCLEALGQFSRMRGDRFAADRRTDRAAAVGFAECAAVALVPGFYYGRLGHRGERARGK